MLGLLVLPLLLGLVAALASRPFRPDPSLVWWRTLVTAIAAAGAGSLMISLHRTWWVIDDWEREATLVTDGTRAFPIMVVTAGAVSAGLVVAGLQGLRNWAPMALSVTWLLVGGAWFATSGELVDSDASGEAGSGLRLATRAMLAITMAATLATLGRWAEHRGQKRREAVNRR